MSRVYVPETKSYNPRHPNDFGLDTIRKEAAYEADVDVQRFDYLDLEGDLPSPSSSSPEQGKLQYFIPRLSDVAEITRHPYATQQVQFFQDWSNGSTLTSTSLQTPNNRKFRGAIRVLPQHNMAEVESKITVAGPNIGSVEFTGTEHNIEFVVRDERQDDVPGKLTLRPQADYTISVSFGGVPTNNDFIILRSASDGAWEAQSPDTLKPNEADNPELRMWIYHNNELNDDIISYNDLESELRTGYSQGTYASLNSLIENIISNSSLYQEQGEQANQFIKQMYKVVGVPWPNDDTASQNYWTAAFVSWVLAVSGFSALRTQAALNYRFYGDEVNWKTWENVRLYDIAVFKSKRFSGGHVGFITGLDLSTNKVKILGGNQGNKTKETEYFIDNVDMYLSTIRRNWTDPGESYKLI